MVEFKLGKKHKRVDHLSHLSMELETKDISEEFLDERLFTVQAIHTWYEYLAHFLNTQKYLEGWTKMNDGNSELIVPILL